MAEPSRPPPSETSGLTVFGRYRLHRRFARGGMAELYVAEFQAAADVWRPVVIKRVLPHLAEEDRYVRMFLDEARLASRFMHPNIVQVLDFGSVDGQYYLAMEYLGGETLRELLQHGLEQGRRLPVQATLAILAGACDGLHYAHEYAEGGKPLEVVHRDVSPSNLMVTYQGEVKVLDFGIARAAERLQEQTGTGVLKGKIAYSAPEQLAGGRADRRTDLFALGVVGWELLAGKRLFRRDSDAATMSAVLHDPIPAPSAACPALAAEPVARALDALILEILCRDPDGRPPTALAVRQRLDRLREGAPFRLDDLLRDWFGSERAHQRVDVRDELSDSRSRSGVRPAPPLTGDLTVALGSAPVRRRSRWPLALAAVGVAGALLVVGVVALALVLLPPREDVVGEAMRLANRGDLQGAEDALERFLQRRPDDPDAQIAAVLVRWWSAAPHIGDAVLQARRAPLDEPQRAMVEGLERINLGRNAEAEAYLAPVAAEFPGRPEPLYVLGEARWHGGDLDDGAATLLQAFDADPRWLMSLHHAVDLALEDRDLATLERVATVLDGVDPAAAVMLRARSRMAEGRYPEAIALLEAATAESPRLGPLWALLAEAQVLDGPPERAYDAARRAHELWPADGRDTAGTAHFAEIALYAGDVPEFLALTPATINRVGYDALWAGVGGSYDGRPNAIGLRSSVHFIAFYLESMYADRRSDRALWETYPDLEIRWLGQGLDAELAGDRAGAELAYETALAQRQSGEARMWIAHHLGRVRAAEADWPGAAEACADVLRPRRYLPYRALVWPDCTWWTALSLPPEQARPLVAELVGTWRGPMVHPAVEHARAWLEGR